MTDDRIESVDSGRIEGRNAVTEALKRGRPIDKLFVSEEGDSSLRHLASIAAERGIPVVRVSRKKLDSMSLSHAHQGVIAVAAAAEYASIDDIFTLAQQSGRPPLIVVCDGISDTGNLGAIVRSAECAGAHGVIIPKRHSAGLTAAAAKAASGALEYIPIVRVPNISAALRGLKERGIWVFGAAAEGASSLYDADLRGPSAIVVGSEGEGISRVVRENCDFIVSIPMLGHLSSLNASVAAGVFLFEAVRQRISGSLK
ncbi:MAG: 23S rRNA (guanosine(2251)-2'-O)-methyltransferase RlmB [Clostridiales bacterium]|nr:23S rRNA (guanosine(2251)-2'-O)-methyltransferase RlmB [Clostridiales bacterium]